MPGRSIWITSAPISAASSAANGCATSVPVERIRTPWSGPKGSGIRDFPVILYLWKRAPVCSPNDALFAREPATRGASCRFWPKFRTAAPFAFVIRRQSIAGGGVLRLPKAGYYISRPTGKISLVFEQISRIGGGAINRRELAFKAMAGLIGGAIGWFPVELATHGHSLTENETTWNFVAVFAAMAILSGAVGGLINAAELQTLEFNRAVKLRFVVGFGVCLVLGLVSNYFSDEAFTSILNAGGWRPGQPGSIAYLIVARVVGWVLMGTLLGVGVGLAGFSLGNLARTIQNVVKGAAGGFVGGFIGGLSFDLVSVASGGGLAPRLLSFSLLGLLIGLFIGLVQELTKSAWLGVEAGRLRGRQFRLEGATVMIGRAEENPVGLFGDPGVQPRHAVIERRADGYALKNLAVQAGTLVNGNRVETVDLHDGDRIRISNYELSFHLRQGAEAAHLATPGPSAAGPTASVQAAAPAAATAGPAGAGPHLIAIDGARFSIRAAATTQIGRALDNDIVLNDASVSRHHAVVEARNGAFTLRDLGSQNGTWLHGQRISEATLGDGDALKLGDAIFTFHA